MTRKEVLQKYSVPSDLLDKYEKARKCTSYSEDDIENISMIMTLYDAGFDDTEVKKYTDLCLSEENTAEKRRAMLAKKRKRTLDEIHLKQKQLDGIDYLRYKVLQEGQNGLKIKNDF